MHKFLIFALYFIIVRSDPFINQLNLLSNASVSALQPFLNTNPAIKAVLATNGTLDQNTQFVPLIMFILNNQTVFKIVLGNISNNNAFFWANNMSISDTRNVIALIMNSSSPYPVSTFYHIFTDSFYLISEKQCQSALRVVLSTNYTMAVSNILAPLKGSYFWNKRCTLSMSPNLVPIADSKINQLTIDQKLLLVPVLYRLGVVHTVIFNVS